MNDFFSITNRVADGDTHTYTAIINASHPVFAGHFPGKPVVPGVMSIMMIRKCAEEITGSATRFAAISQCKFNNAIIPDSNPITITFSVNGAAVAADITSVDGTSLLKLKATLA